MQKKKNYKSIIFEFYIIKLCCTAIVLKKKLNTIMDITEA